MKEKCEIENCKHKAKFLSPKNLCLKHWTKWFWLESKKDMPKSKWRQFLKSSKKSK